MALTDLTREAVEQAIAEYDTLGRDAFLDRYGYRPARSYFLMFEGRSYDSKAIVGVANKYVSAGSAPLQPADFSGGEKTVARTLENLGFEVHGDISLVDAPYEAGRSYNRREDIHAKFGGQQQGGISTPDSAPFIFLFTGEIGEQYGYADGWSEGVFLYVGEGQRGDMEFIRGNKAIRDHATNGKELLLFEALKRKGEYRYAGKFSCAGWHMREAPDADGAKRQVIVFELVPPEANEEVDTTNENPAEGLSLSALRARAMEAATAESVPDVREARRTYYRRSLYVKAYVCARAKGLCEACGKPAPFTRADGTPYLEPHHSVFQTEVRTIRDASPRSAQTATAKYTMVFMVPTST